MKNLKVSKYLHFLPMDKEISIGWNRYFPSIFILNDAALDLMDRIKTNKPIEMNEEIEQYLQEFKNYKFLYEEDDDGSGDPFREDFVRIVREETEKPDREAKELTDREKIMRN